MVRTHTVCLDTHAIVWAYAGETEKIGKEARTLIGHGDLVASPAAVLELQLLHEIGRVAPTVETIMDTLARDIMKTHDVTHDQVLTALSAGR